VTEESLDRKSRPLADLLVDKPRNGLYKGPAFIGSGASYFRMGDLFHNDRVRSSAAGFLRISVTNEERIRHSVQRGDLLFCRTSVAAQGVGKCSLVVEASEPLIPASNLIRVRPNTAVADPRFLYYYFGSSAGGEAVRSFTRGAAVFTITGPDLGSVPVPDLPLSAQRAFADVLSCVDDLIENNHRRVEVLEEMARAIYQEWFVRFRYPGHDDVPLVDSLLGPIPDGWECSPFSDLADFVNGYAFRPAQWGSLGRPIIKIKELKQGVTTATPRCVEEDIDQKYWIEPGDLLFSWSADLGVYRWSGEPGLLNQHLFVVTPRDGQSTSFLQHALDGAMTQFWDRAQGTTMRHIKRSALVEVSALVPPVQVVDAFTKAVGPWEQETLTLQRLGRNLTDLRDLLLPRLVTGKIDVSNLDLDALTEAAMS